MSRRNIIIIVVVALAIVAIAAFFVVGPGIAPAPATPTGGTPDNSVSKTRAPVPANVVVPKQGETTAADVAPPQVVSPANAHTSVQYRSFNIQASGNQFTPSTVIVNQGDVVNIIFTAVDKNYDFTQPDYGFRQVIQKGQTKTIQFGATATGKFTFYCASCGGPTQGPIGYVIVTNPK